jgi:hypothetical protein
MVDLSSETLLTLAQAARLVPPGRNGRKTYLSTIHRWILKGVRLPSGEVVRLEAIRLSSRWLTSREALQRFAERQTPRLDGDLSSPRTPLARHRASERAARRLERIGI